MMNMIAVDTSTERAAIAVSTRQGTVLVAATESGRRHGRDLIPHLAVLLAEARMDATALEMVGIGLGPGSYTGLRVGVMAAKTLAYVSGAALVGIDSLAVVARNAPEESTRISVIGDAQRGDLYVAEFVRETPRAPMVQTHPTHIERLADWRERLEPGQTVLGPGLESGRIRALIPVEFLQTSIGANFPQGHALIDLVRQAWSSGRRDNPWTLEPNYLRKSAAEEKWADANPSS